MRRHNGSAEAIRLIQAEGDTSFILRNGVNRR